MSTPATTAPAPKDPNRFKNPVPTAIAAQAKAIEAMYANGAKPGIDNPEPAPGDTPPAPPVTEAAPAPAAEPAPTPAPEPKAAEPPAPEPKAAAPAEDWEHKFKSLHGKHKQDLAEMAELRTQLGALQTTLKAMREAAAEAPKPVTPEVTDLSRDEIETYGQDLVDVIGRRARATVAPEVQALRDEIARLKTQVADVTTTTAKSEAQQFMERLHAAVGGAEGYAGFKRKDEDPDFLAWLQEMEVYSGKTRLALLHEAAGNRDLQRAARFYSDFFRDEKPAGGSPSTTPPPAPAPAAVSMETLAAPGRAKPGTGNAPPAKPERIWTGASIKQFYRDKANGVFFGRAAEADAIERDIVAAGMENRVRN